MNSCTLWPPLSQWNTVWFPSWMAAMLTTTTPSHSWNGDSVSTLVMVRVFIDRVISFELSEGILILLFTNIQNQELNTVHDPHSPVYASRKKGSFSPVKCFTHYHSKHLYFLLKSVQTPCTCRYNLVATFWFLVSRSWVLIPLYFIIHS